MTPTRVASMLKSLGCPSKLRLALAIDGESSVSELSVKADMPQTHASIILTRWKAMGAIKSERRGHRRSPEVIDRLLNAIDVSEFTERVLITALIATAPIAYDLKGREAFAERVRGKMVNARGEEYARDQLQGLT